MSRSPLAGRFPQVSPDFRWARLTDPARADVLKTNGLRQGDENPVLDRVARLAAAVLGVPIALVSLVTANGQHFPGLHGLGGWAGEQRGTPLSHSFCQHVVTSDAPLIVEDAADVPQLGDNLAVPDLGVIAYAGVPIRSAAGETLGALCAIDNRPVTWTTEQIMLLEDLSALVTAEVEARLNARKLAELERQMTERLERDPLTGALTRRGFMRRAQERLHREGDRHHALMIWDVEAFRGINARWGSEVADDVLVELAAVLTTTMPRDAMIGRIGDDEFAVFCGSDVDDAEVLSRRVAAALDEVNASHNHTVTWQTTIGEASTTTFATSDVEELMRRATASRRGSERKA